MPHPPEVQLAPSPAPAHTNLLCEACMDSCGSLTLQGSNPYLTGENISTQVQFEPHSIEQILKIRIWPWPWLTAIACKTDIEVSGH